MKQEITIDAKGQVFQPMIVRRALVLIGERFGISEPADFIRENCLWIVPLNQWAHFESLTMVVDNMTSYSAPVDAKSVLAIANFERTLLGAPVYRMLAGSLGMSTPEIDSDVLLVMGGKRPEVVLRSTGLGTVSPEMAENLRTGAGMKLLTEGKSI